MEDRKLRLVFELFGFGEFHVVPLCVHEFLHKGDICGFGEPALFVQQCQDTRRVVLQKKKNAAITNILPFTYFIPKKNHKNISDCPEVTFGWTYK